MPLCSDSPPPHTYVEPFRRCFALLTCSALLSLAQTRARAAEALPLPAQTPARELPGTANALRSNTNAVPALPGTKTAADTFRELLDMTPAGRERALADRTPEQRKYLQDSLRKYRRTYPGPTRSTPE